jgi:hypothetical protein
LTFIGGLWIFPVVYADAGPGTTIDADVGGTSVSTNQNYQRKSFYAEGLYWLFNDDNNYLSFRTSSDGETYNTQTDIRALVTTTGSNGQSFSTWYDGVYCYYVACTNQSSGVIVFRRGTPLGNGTIDWSAAEQTVVANHSFSLFVSVDSGGHPWVEVADYTYKSSTTDGTWVEDTANGFPYYDAYISPGGRSIIPLLNGKMLVYAQVTLGPGEARAWSGTSWGSRILTSFDTNGFYNYSAVGQGDTVEFASTRKAGLIYTAVHFVYTYSTNTFSSPLTIRTIEDGIVVSRAFSLS